MLIHTNNDWPLKMLTHSISSCHNWSFVGYNFCFDLKRGAHTTLITIDAYLIHFIGNYHTSYLIFSFAFWLFSHSKRLFYNSKIMRTCSESRGLN